MRHRDGLGVDEVEAAVEREDEDGVVRGRDVRVVAVATSLPVTEICKIFGMLVHCFSW